MKILLGLMGLGAVAVIPFITQLAHAGVDCAALITRLVAAVGAEKAKEIIANIPSCS